MTYIRINTTDSLDYRYFPITKSRFNVTVKAAHDARICLRTSLDEDSNLYEIIIGGWGNSLSAIRRNNQDPDVAEAETRNILDPGEEVDLIIQWCCDGLISVGRDISNMFLSYKDTDPFVINYIGVSTAWGATGEWIIEESPCTALAIRQQLTETSHLWQTYNDTVGLPPTAVVASEDGLYIGRCHHLGSVTPGGIRVNTCTIAWGGISHEKNEFQVLCGKDVHWEKSWEGSVPLHALPAGETEDGYALFIGRVLHEDGMYYVGKVQPNHQVCYIPVNGQELACQEYEVLVAQEDYIPECIGR